MSGTSDGIRAGAPDRDAVGFPSLSGRSDVWRGLGRAGPRCRRVLGRVTCIVGVLAALYGLHCPILRAAAWPLLVADDVRPSDVALVVGGDRCLEEAARLYADGTVRGVLLIETAPGRLVRQGILPPAEETARRALVQHGVPVDAVTLIPGRAAGEWEAARQLRVWLDAHAPMTVLALCARLGARHSRFVCGRVLGSARMARICWHPLGDRRYDENDWWQKKAGVLDLFNSYMALGYAWSQGERPGGVRDWDPDAWLESRLGMDAAYSGGASRGSVAEAAAGAAVDGLASRPADHR